MLTFWYLFTALLIGNMPASAIPQAFDTEDACNDAGQKFAAVARADKTVDRAVWTCAEVDFEKADPRA